MAAETTAMEPKSDDTPRHRFRPEQKLRKSDEFDRAYQAGQSAAGRSLVVRVAQNDVGHCRLGMAVSRKVAGSVGRYRIRRLIREAFRLRQHDLPAACDIVVTPRRTWREPSLHELGDELVELVGKALRRKEKT